MISALAFIGIGITWLIFRKWIAEMQYRAVMQMLRGSQELDKERVRAIEKIGVLFSVLLLLSGSLMLILNLLVTQ